MWSDSIAYDEFVIPQDELRRIIVRRDNPGPTGEPGCSAYDYFVKQSSTYEMDEIKKQLKELKVILNDLLYLLKNLDGVQGSFAIDGLEQLLKE